MSKTKKMVQSALLIAMAVVLSEFAVFRQPYGGSITIASMVPLILISFKYGWKWGFFSAIAYSLIDMMLHFYAPPAGTLPAFIAVIMLDYIIAYGALGLASIWGKTWYAAVIVCVIRFLAHFISGMIIWDTTFIPSLIYNGSYMLPETIITTLVLVVMLKVSTFRSWFEIPEVKDQ